jgi:hypothetical protein
MARSIPLVGQHPHHCAFSGNQCQQIGWAWPGAHGLLFMKLLVLVLVCIASQVTVMVCFTSVSLMTLANG